MTNLTYERGWGKMQLNKTTDYAARIVYVLSNENRNFTSEEVAKATGVSRGYVISILRRLSKAELVEVIRGVKGGFRLKKKPDKISLFDVIKAMEVTMCINQCLDEEENCNLHVTGQCPVRKFYLSLQEQMESELRNMTFEMLKKSGGGENI